MSRPLRIAIEANVLALPRATGVARYVQQLALALDRLPDPERREFEATLLYRFKRRRHRGLIQLGRGLRRSVWVAGLWPPANRFDCVLCTFKHAPDWPAVPRLATIHDMHYELGMGSGSAAEDAELLKFRRRLIDGAEHLICVSEATRRDLIRFHPRAQSRSTVIHLGVSDSFAPAPAAAIGALRRRLALERPFLLFMGHGAASKNLPRMIEAFLRSPAADGIDLVVAGPATETQAVREAVGRDPRRRVRPVGFVEEAELPALYSAASAFLLPSLSEGFGLPILEAMRCGTPVLTSDRGSCPEVANGWAVLVDPYDTEALAEGLGRVLATPAATRDAARRYAESKTWALTARETLRVLGAVTGRR